LQGIKVNIGDWVMSKDILIEWEEIAVALISEHLDEVEKMKRFCEKLILST